MGGGALARGFDGSDGHAWASTRSTGCVWLVARTWSALLVAPKSGRDSRNSRQNSRSRRASVLVRKRKTVRNVIEVHDQIPHSSHRQVALDRGAAGPSDGRDRQDLLIVALRAEVGTRSLATPLPG